MTQEGLAKMSNNRNNKRTDPSFSRKRETKNSSILRLNKSKPKPSNTQRTPRNKKAEVEKISDNAKEDTFPATGVFLTQDVSEEERSSVPDPEGQDVPRSMEQHREDTKTQNKTEGSSNTNVHKKEEDNSNTTHMDKDKCQDTSKPDRTVTKCSTDSGIADLEPAPGLGPRYLSEVKAGIRKEYFQGLDNLRKMISDIEKELDQAALEFYCCHENDEDKYEEYLRKSNDKFLMCNNILRKKHVNLEVIDSEIKILSLLNKLREMHDDVDHDIIDHVTEFYEHLKLHMDKIHMISVKYRNTVLKILQSSCTSYYNNETNNLEVSVVYREEVKCFIQDIILTLEHLDLLVKSYQNCIKQELFTNSNFSERVLICCDQKAFPILRIIPDICEKITHVCQQSRQWVDKDQIYIQDINNHIRQRRNLTKKKEQDLKKQEEELDTKIKGVKEACDLFKTNKKELQRLEKRLQVVEKRVKQCAISKSYKEEERRRKEGMVGFLEISITQTKKNTSLQLKRNRLQKQLKELADSIRQTELELSQVQNDLICIQKNRHTMEGKVEESNKIYTSLKTELDQLNAIVKALQKEMSELNNGLTELEIIHNFKTSPEKVEDFYERPVSVKLAPSLKEKIKQKWKKRMNSKTK